MASSKASLLHSKLLCRVEARVAAAAVAEKLPRGLRPNENWIELASFRQLLPLAPCPPQALKEHALTPPFGHTPGPPAFTRARAEAATPATASVDTSTEDFSPRPVTGADVRGT